MEAIYLMNNQAKESSGSPVCAHTIKLSTQWNCFPRQDGGWSIRKQTVHILQWKGLQVTLAQGHRHFISQDQTPQMVNWGGKPLNAWHSKILRPGLALVYISETVARRGNWSLCARVKTGLQLKLPGSFNNIKKAAMLRARPTSITPNLGRDAWEPTHEHF